MKRAGTFYRERKGRGKEVKEIAETGLQTRSSQRQAQRCNTEAAERPPKKAQNCKKKQLDIGVLVY